MFKFLSISGVMQSICVKFVASVNVFHCLESDRWPEVSEVGTTEFYYVSPDPYWGSGYKTSVNVKYSNLCSVVIII